MTDPEKMSVQTFAQALGELIRHYLLTFDPAAPTELQNIQLRVAGKNLGLIYTEQGGEPPALSINLTRMERLSDLPPLELPVVDPSGSDPRRGGLFGRS